MEIKKGTRLNVNSQRKGIFKGIADRDFDTNKEEWYPISVDQDAPVNSLKGTPKWFKGDSIPCRNILCEISVVD